MDKFFKVIAIIVLTVLSVTVCQRSFVTVTTITPAGEVEATEYEGMALTPISKQLNNAISGTKNINKDTYSLRVEGLVDRPLNLSYQDLLGYTQVSRVIKLDCVEGWSFTAKWTGPTLNEIFKDCGIQNPSPQNTPNTVIFYTADDSNGYTSLDLGYITGNDIMLGLKINDVTLSADRGFPFQVVAEGKYGYKWAKWVTRIEIVDDKQFRGYWESRGYNNNAAVGGPIGGG
jgi:DMSO/TMAO reductase YedYZ molybdopterin-dependent catalytic subunit